MPLSGTASLSLSESSSTVGVITAPVPLTRLLVAIDASDYANRAITEAVRLAAAAGGTLTGIHAYAARLHDRRFRQMEGGLPLRYREEGELERQREVHDSLITRGLGIIGDSYHEAAERACGSAAVPYRRLSPEGKNYRRIVESAASGDFDVLVLGARGLGAASDGAIGTVCERVTRRSPIDVCVIADHRRPIGGGPLVVGIDGSPASFGALRTALDLGRRLATPVHAVAAYDPYFHYVAFRRIAEGLSEEAGRVFRFKEQEKLHEEIIDDGLARIYSSHLEVARAVAVAESAEIVTALLDGKPYQAIVRYLARVGASMVLVGKTGVHADPDLDIGGTAENLLRMAPCHVWIGTAVHTPPLDAVARETIVWSVEAEQSIARVPERVRGMVRVVILRYAQQQGHTVITSGLVEEATRRFCPGHRNAAGENEIRSRNEAGAHVAGVASAPASAEGTGGHVPEFPGTPIQEAPGWPAAALARLHRVPEMAREAVRVRAEAHALAAGGSAVTLATVEAAIADSRRAMEEAMRAGGHGTVQRPGE